MVDKHPVETLGELQIWIEGEFKLIAAGQAALEKDLGKVREYTHETANKVSAVAALATVDRMNKFDSYAKEIEVLKLKEAERKTALATLRTVYLLGGTALGTIATVALSLAKFIHL